MMKQNLLRYRFHHLQKQKETCEQKIKTLLGDEKNLDQMALQRLKRQHLNLKKELEHIGDTLNPDIIA